MTEQEAEVLAARLTRLWATGYAPTPRDWVLYQGYFTFYLDVAPDVDVSIFASKEIGIQATLRYDEFEIDCNKEGQISPFYLPSMRLERHAYEQFADEWMPFFRRNCWLSGCPIEATAHEKAEWLQGFTRQEIEAWNLDFS